MKRIQSACLEQTIHFQLNENLGHEEAVNDIKTEVEKYKAQLKHKRIQYKIEEEKTQPDGSVTVKIKKQYNGKNCGEYLA
ncbi:hypothetical protein [Caproiciproducens sp. CPB-2]|uniref:hypothetical protein n=1 Tax=unclassified Caproiciproducens TaxID=2643836 RepID=UPI0023D9BA68|nr:hypothetical protein [Caproiciproducens sp. CPB-2]MDF1493432.1 hypothetical protein [Caproiciproducens sp. CPB-2]